MTKTPDYRFAVALFTFVLSPASLIAQQEASASAPDYLLPDVAPKWMTQEGRLFSNRIGFALLYDYTAVEQNAASVTQVGVQHDAADLRAGRVTTTGNIKFRRPWSYRLAVDYNEGRVPEDQIFEGLDAYVTIPLWGDAGISIGKQKEPFVYEMAGDAANLPQHERMLSPFFVTRSAGVKITDLFLDERMSFSAGWFNDSSEDDVPFKENGNDFAVRLTGLPVISADGSRYLQLGIGARYAGDTRGMLRLKGRPESNVTSNYVDTGEFAGRAVRTLSLEMLWTDGPLSVLAELASARADAPDVGDPSFLGSYFIFSYVLTGENRPYDRQAAYARRIMPTSRSGAFEVFGRYSAVDLTDRAISGGEMSKWTVGLNWWATQQWKFSLSLGQVALDRAGLEGRTTTTLLRSQWIF